MSQPDPRRISKALGPLDAAEREPIGKSDKLRALVAELAIAEERERRRIAGGLHDHVGQLLGIAKVRLGEALAAQPVDDVAGPVSESRRLLDLAIREIRALTFELSSPVLQELGLAAALVNLAERMEERHGVPCQLELGSGLPSVSEEVAVLLHSIVRELLWNVVKHARAQLAVLAIGPDLDRLRIEVRDDGVGFDAARVFDRLSQTGGLGLLGARNRLEYLGGTIEVESAPGRGTKIVLTVPGCR